MSEFSKEITIGEQMARENRDAAELFVDAALRYGDMESVTKALLIKEKSEEALRHFTWARLAGIGLQAALDRDAALRLVKYCGAQLEALSSLEWVKDGSQIKD
jgi:hypothetical protein